MNASNIKDMFLEVSTKIQTQEEMLCKLDSYVGDGDHGVTVARGFKQVHEVLEANTYDCPADVFKAIGDTLTDAMGGAIGPIIGSLFLAGVKKTADKTDFDATDFVFMFEKGLKRIQLIGEAKLGDRTMVDALSPAVDAMKAAVDNGGDLKACFMAGKEAAIAGAESTKEMVATKGRAKFLQEKSLGYVDAGATTVSLIITYIYDFIKGE